jgi:hypothetical protein
MLVAVLLGGLLGLMLDVVVFIPAIIIGATITTWRGLAICYTITLAIVLALKVPVIREIAEELQKPDKSLAEIALWYAAAIGIWVLLVVLIRRVVSGEWPIRETKNG